MERLHVAPEVLYFRNVLTDSEIEVVKALGRPKVREFRISFFNDECFCVFGLGRAGHCYGLGL